jgi:hypothetical protein
MLLDFSRATQGGSGTPRRFCNAQRSTVGDDVRRLCSILFCAQSESPYVVSYKVHSGISAIDGAALEKSSNIEDDEEDE